MKRKKGFTLVELLVIIAVIAVISSFALISIDKKSSQFSTLSNEKLKQIIESATHSYIISNNELMNKVKSNDKGYTIKLNTLIEKGYISNKDLKNLKTRKDIDPSNVEITVVYSLNTEKTSYIYIYDIEGID